jgi:hypothetical protein
MKDDKYWTTEIEEFTEKTVNELKVIHKELGSKPGQFVIATQSFPLMTPMVGEHGPVSSWKKNELGEYLYNFIVYFKVAPKKDGSIEEADKKYNIKKLNF